MAEHTETYNRHKLWTLFRRPASVPAWRAQLHHRRPKRSQTLMYALNLLASCFEIK